jgi:hypothetical protein
VGVGVMHGGMEVCRVMHGEMDACEGHAWRDTCVCVCVEGVLLRDTSVVTDF